MCSSRKPTGAWTGHPRWAWSVLTTCLTSPADFFPDFVARAKKMCYDLPQGMYALIFVKTQNSDAPERQSDTSDSTKRTQLQVHGCHWKPKPAFENRENEPNSKCMDATKGETDTAKLRKRTQLQMHRSHRKPRRPGEIAKTNPTPSAWM